MSNALDIIRKKSGNCEYVWDGMVKDAKRDAIYVHELVGFIWGLFAAGRISSEERSNANKALIDFLEEAYANARAKK